MFLLCTVCIGLRYTGVGTEGKENVGPKAVVRNISKVLRGQPAKVVSRTQLLLLCSSFADVARVGVLHVGTVRSNWKGWCREIQYTQNKKPLNMPRGQYRIDQAKSILS
ncbi:hypothetical protein GQ600_24036 [Phytophthora cactorum]|nr:hypothetical protein GQ600_24036 [Phytophthora cactorum]